METQMQVTFTEEELENGLYKFSLEGTLDAPGTITIEDDFQQSLTQAGGQVIIDLAGVDYMSSYGLRMLLICAKALKNAGGELHLAGPTPNVMELIKLAGYDTMFPVYETVEEAILFLSG
jgi:anti-sigma B factor antagonist